jgi:hypothetical protein
MTFRPWQLWRSNLKYIIDKNGFILQIVKNTQAHLQEINGEL